MNRKLAIGLCMISGFCCGALVSFLSAERVHAQRKYNVETVVCAQKFELVNPDGSTAGTFGFDANGNPEITLMDSSGKILWSTQAHLKAIHR